MNDCVKGDGVKDEQGFEWKPSLPASYGSLGVILPNKSIH